MSGPTANLEPLIAACLAGGDREALARELRSRLRRIAGPDQSSRALLRAAENLLAGMLSGGVTNLARAGELLGEAEAELEVGRRAGTPASGALTDRVLDLVEQLDLLASGVTDAGLDSLGPGSPGTDPPVLIERVDGSRVELGRFDEPVAAQPRTAVGESGLAALPSTVDAIVEAMNAAVTRLGGHVDSLGVIAVGERDVDAQRIIGEMSATVRDLEGLKDALAKWVLDSAALLREPSR